ncbi:MAG: N-acetylglucosamine-6-phosphate deacetylase [Provencibacterium sp.]|nr:N-acetylglucosamine-6-phosphate deacetylase [Provencibacterium sp.]
MLLKNARVFHPDYHFEKADVRIENGRILEVASSIAGGGENLEGQTLIPGLCDIHSHGCVGGDWSRPDRNAYRKMARYYAQNGVTSLCATTMTLAAAELEGIMEALGRFAEEETGGAYLTGINMEGPFFSKKRKGAQSEEHILDPDVALFQRLQACSGGRIRLCDIAPELPGAGAFIEEVKKSAVISLAHTDASYETAKKAFSLGACHATHLYNAMSLLVHREPGVVGAVLDTPGVVAELISDGIHLHPAVVRLTFSILRGRVALISDSIEACGMPNGEYELGGQPVTVQNGKATLHDGTIAGSATDLFTCMRRAISFGVPPEEAVRAATSTPAESIGVTSTGKIEAGRSADLCLVDDDFCLQRVWVRGREIDRG